MTTNNLFDPWWISAVLLSRTGHYILHVEFLIRSNSKVVTSGRAKQTFFCIINGIRGLIVKYALPRFFHRTLALNIVSIRRFLLRCLYIFFSDRMNLPPGQYIAAVKSPTLSALWEAVTIFSLENKKMQCHLCNVLNYMLLLEMVERFIKLKDLTEVLFLLIFIFLSVILCKGTSIIFDVFCSY